MYSCECRRYSSCGAHLPARLYSRGTPFHYWEMRENEGRVKASQGNPPQVPLRAPSLSHTQKLWLVLTLLGHKVPPTPPTLWRIFPIYLIHIINYLYSLERLRLSSHSLISTTKSWSVLLFHHSYYGGIALYT